MPNDKDQYKNFADLIWKVADLLRGSFQEDDYGTIILPFTLLRRIECALEPTRQAVLDEYKIRTAAGMLSEDKYELFLQRKADAPFFNTTPFRLKTLSAGQTLADILAYKDGFSSNVKTIFDKFNFNHICGLLNDANLLYATIQFFKALDLTRETIPDRVMSNVYEELIWRFASTKHKQSKEFLTPRDIIRLATTLVLRSDPELLTSNKGLIRSIYDPTCGTMGFITDAMDCVEEYATSNSVTYPATLAPYGQEINPVSWAMGKAMMLLRSTGQDLQKDLSEQVRLGNTLLDDLQEGKTFDFVLSNPPFGMDFSNEYDSVIKDPRFADVGIPPKSDGSMLFLTHVVRKIAEHGHGAIVLSGSPLFSGGAGSGSSNIRRWMLKNDYVEAIIQMPGGEFYNTSIQTYLWLLSKDKPEQKRHKVQLIDATELKTPIKNIGNKRFIFSDGQINQIARLVGDFKETEISKIVDYRDFGYRAVTVQCPLRLELQITEDGIAKLMADKSLAKLDDVQKQKVRNFFTTALGQTKKLAFAENVRATAKVLGIKLGKPFEKAVIATFGVSNPDGEIALDSKGNLLYDSDKKQIENVPLDEDIGAYMKREVLPFVPDAVVDESVRDDQDGMPGIVGFEINFNKYFYKYEAPRAPEVIAAEIQELEAETAQMMKELF